MTIYFNNTLASFSRSLREFKEKAYGFMYDIGTWLKETYENLTERPATHNRYTPKEKPLVEVEEIEMKELNRTYKPFQTPLIALFTIIRTDRNMLLACYSHKHISYRIRTIIRKAISTQQAEVLVPIPQIKLLLLDIHLKLLKQNRCKTYV